MTDSNQSEKTITEQATAWEKTLYELHDNTKNNDLIKTGYYHLKLQDAVNAYAQSCEYNELSILLGNIKGKKILELGAGRGILSLLLASNGAEVTAVDPAQGYISGFEQLKVLTSKDTTIKIEYINKSAEEYIPEKQEYDIVICRSALHHASSLNKFVEVAYSALKVNGKFIALREHVISKKRDLTRFLKNHPLHSKYGGEHAYTLKEYKNAFSSAKFSKTTVLHPFSSKINSFEDYEFKIKSVLRSIPIINNKLILRFATHPGVRYIIASLYHSPGRIYSFIAEK